MNINKYSQISHINANILTTRKRYFSKVFTYLEEEENSITQLDNVQRGVGEQPLSWLVIHKLVNYKY